MFLYTHISSKIIHVYSETYFSLNFNELILIQTEYKCNGNENNGIILFNFT